MSPVARRFRVGSATVVFAVVSLAWFAFVLSISKDLLAGSVRSPELADVAMSSGIKATVPLVIVTVIAFVTVNVSQSEGLSWLFAGAAFLISAIGFVLWLSRQVGSVA
jgi:hypothetical protein